MDMAQKQPKVGQVLHFQSCFFLLISHLFLAVVTDEFSHGPKNWHKHKIGNLLVHRSLADWIQTFFCHLFKKGTKDIQYWPWRWERHPLCYHRQVLFSMLRAGHLRFFMNPTIFYHQEKEETFWNKKTQDVSSPSILIQFSITIHIVCYSRIFRSLLLAKTQKWRSAEAKS